MRRKTKTDHSKFFWMAIVVLTVFAVVSLLNSLDQKTAHPTNESVSFLVAHHRHADLAAALEKSPEGVGDKSFDGRFALQIAAEDGCVACISLLVKAGADVNQPMNDGKYMGCQPIHFATINGRLEAIKLLASAGASIDSVNASGSTPLMLAVQNNREGLVGHLLQIGADPNFKDSFGWQPIHWAALKGLNEAVQYLVEAKAQVNEEVLATIFMEKFPVPKGKHVGSLTVKCFENCDPHKAAETISLGLYNWTNAPEKILPAEKAELEQTPQRYNPVRLSRLLCKDVVTAYLKANGGKD